MSDRAKAWAASKTTGCPCRKSVLMALADDATPSGVVRAFDAASISDRTEWSQPEVIGALIELSELGLVKMQAWASGAITLSMAENPSVIGGDK